MSISLFTGSKHIFLQPPFSETLGKEPKVATDLIQPPSKRQKTDQPDFKLALRPPPLKSFKMDGDDLDSKRKQDKEDAKFPLHANVRKNQFLKLKEHLKEHPEDIHQTNKDGQTLLHLAASLGAVIMVELLLDFKPNLYANNNKGYTPLHEAMINSHYPTTRFLSERMLKSEITEPAWYTSEKIHTLIDQFQSDHASPSDEQIDTFIADLLGIPLKTLNQTTDIIKYTSHLLRLEGDIFGIEAEGWWSHRVMEQRIRTLALAVLKHPIFPPEALGKGQTHEAVRKIFIQEIATECETLRLARRMHKMHGCEPEAMQKMVAIEARNIMTKSMSQKTGQEYALPLGFPGHALYAGIAKTQAFDGKQMQPVLRVRIDNLGSGYSRAHLKDENTSKVSSYVLNIPLDFLNKPANIPIYEKFIAGLILTKTMDYKKSEDFYSEIASFQNLLKEHYSEVFIHDRTGMPNDDRHAPQSVGNCSLENHTRGIRARLQSRETYKWFSQFEEAYSEKMFSEHINNALSKRLEDKYIRGLKDIFTDYENASLAKKLNAFLKKEEHRVSISKVVTVEKITKLLDQKDNESIRALLTYGLDPDLADSEDSQRSLLHYAVEKNNKEVVALLLDHKASINSQDAQGRTALFRAVELGNNAISALLRSRGADQLKANNEGKTPLQLAEEQSRQAEALLLSLKPKPARVKIKRRNRRYKP